MAYQETNSKLLSNLDMYSSNLTKYNMPKSAQIVDEVNTYIVKMNEASLNKILINSKIKDLQTLTTQEFGITLHRKKVFSKILTTMSDALTINSTESKHILDSSGIRELTGNRITTLRYSKILASIITKGATNTEEKFVGYCYDYMAIVDGVYRNSIRACYMWEQLSRNEQVDTCKVPNIKINEIRDYFKDKSRSDVYFEGLNNVIRNAVAHSTFAFDSNLQKMKFEDKIARRTEMISLQEILELREKMMNVFEANFFVNQIFAITDIFNVFTTKYP